MYRTDGIVVREMRYRETSKIITIFSSKYGLMDVYARGAYRPKSSLTAQTGLFAMSNFQLKDGNGLFYIRAVDSLDSYYGIRNRYERLLIGSYILDLVYSTANYGESSYKNYLLVVKALKVLEKLNGKYLEFIIAFTLKYLSFLGFKPNLKSCVKCGKEASEYLFGNSDGGLVCKSCYSRQKIYKISKDEASILNDLLYSKLELIELIDNEINSIKLYQIIKSYLLYCVDKRRFISLDMFERTYYLSTNNKL